jgi:hypothetical protein
MKKIIAAIAAGFVALASLAGCASTGSTTQTPAQIAAAVCPAVQTELATVESAGVFTGGAADTLTNQVIPDVAAVCSATESATSTGISGIANTVIPLIVTAINNSSLDSSAKTTYILAIGAIQTTINLALGLTASTNAVAVGLAAPAAQ